MLLTDPGENYMTGVQQNFFKMTFQKISTSWSNKDEQRNRVQGGNWWVILEMTFYRILPDPDHLRNLEEFPPPPCLKSLRRVVGMFACYAKWVEHFADNFRPLAIATEFPSQLVTQLSKPFLNFFWTRWGHFDQIFKHTANISLYNFNTLNRNLKLFLT